MSMDTRIPYVARAIRILRTTQTALAEFSQNKPTTDHTKRKVAAAAKRVSRVIAIELKKLEAK